ncbi:hypothetical protein [Streptomyces sp. NPDC050856]|uniref:hypothetical protein n=1 Tax=Streptomyces sp. NPDC050856 TaxID=3154939 RepID=UPI0033F9AB96
MQTQRQLGPVLAHQRRIAALAASSAGIQSLGRVLGAIDRSGFQQIAERMSAIRQLTDSTQSWQQQSAQLRSGLNLIKTQAPAGLWFSAQTYQHAEHLLDHIAQSPPDQWPESVEDDLLPEAEPELEEMVRAFQPAVRGMAAETARSVVIGYVATVVFLLVIQLSITHPEMAELLIGSSGLDALTSAAAAGWATGKVWDRLHPSEGETPSSGD